MKGQKTQYPIQDRWSYLYLGIATGIGFFWEIPIFTWLGPILLLRFMRTQKVWRGVLLVWLASFLNYSLTFHQELPLEMPEYIITMAVMAFAGSALAFLIDRLVVTQIRGFAATLVFPLTITSLDYIGGMINPMGSVGDQAYLHANNLPFMQLAAITGMWGLVFLTNWLGSIINWTWEANFDWQIIKRGVVAYAAIQLLVIVFGSARLVYADIPAGTIRVHGINETDVRTELDYLHDLKADDWQGFREFTAGRRELYLAASVREAQAGAELVVWPEMAVYAPEEDEAAFFDSAAAVASENSIYLAMPMVTSYQDGRRSVNKMVIMDPTGEIVLDHHKYGNALQEGFAPGDGVFQTVATPFGTLSGIVCNDTNHQEVVSQAGRNGTDILLSSSLEYEGLIPMHAQMAAFRAIENGITIVRQAGNGLSVVIDPYGRVLATMNHFKTDERVMVAQVPTFSVPTLYPYTTDWFAYLSLIGTLVVIIAAIANRIRKKITVRSASQPEASQAV